MTDEEKIKSEIERRRNIVKNSALQMKDVEKRNHYLEMVEEYDDILRYVDSLPEEPVSEDLEEAADNALNNVLNTHEIVNIRSCLEMFKFGAKWQKEQMMKFGKCGIVGKDFQVELEDGGCIDLDPSMQLKPAFEFEEGQKVKVIIIKED